MNLEIDSSGEVHMLEDVKHACQWWAFDIGSECMEGIVRIIRRQSRSSGSISMQVHRYTRLLVIVAAYQGVFYFSQHMLYWQKSFVAMRCDRTIGGVRLMSPHGLAGSSDIVWNPAV